jgi:hypothetical protein
MSGERRDLLERQIAQEAMRVVYQSTGALTGPAVAMKVPKSLSLQTQREVEILQCVSHRYIIQLHDYIECPDDPVLIFALAAGDLFGFIPLDGFDEAAVKQIIHKVLLALAYLHGNMINLPAVRFRPVRRERLNPSMARVVCSFRRKGTTRLTEDPDRGALTGTTGGGGEQPVPGA